jgi:hypothetical protein
MDAVNKAILRTVAYSDVFQFPLTEAEIHRFLIGMRVSREEVRSALNEDLIRNRYLAVQEGHYMLPGNEQNLAIRRKRQEFSARLWPRAFYYGKWIARLPFVRMVAVTGSLSMDNADSRADLDYLVVTRTGRVWSTRALVILLVRLAAQRGDTICPNYFLSERALIIPEQNLFTAHELVQMVPVSGVDVLRGIWLLNGWVRDYLPNADSPYFETTPSGLYAQKIRPALERLLEAAPLLSGLEGWEMRRKIRKFSQAFSKHPEATFNPDCCKGHFDDHGYRVLNAYKTRLLAMEDVLV